MLLSCGAKKSFEGDEGPSALNVRAAKDHYVRHSEVSSVWSMGAKESVVIDL